MQAVVSLDPCRRLLRSPVALAVLVAAACSVVVELLPRVGGDLLAQRWWVSWVSSGGQPVEFGWYGGSPAVSYSLLAPWVTAALGLPLAGVLGTVVGAAATTGLLVRSGATRPRAAAVAAALTFAADQASGRTTFGLGVAAGLLALCAAGPGRPRRVPAAALAALAGALSPVAAAFVVLAAAAWWLARARGPERPSAAALVLTAGALLPLAAMRLLDGADGPMTARAPQMAAAVLAAAVTGLVLDPRLRVARTGAALTVLALLVSWHTTNPMGSNTTRLVLLFAVPLVVGAARWPGAGGDRAAGADLAGARRDTALGVVVAAAVVWLLPPVLPADLVPRDLGAAQARVQPLLAELAARGPVGRVEVVPLAGHEEALLVAGQVPLARGWTRQLDVARNPLFYDGTLDADTYREWLLARGVSYVAVSDGRPDWAARQEAQLVRAGVPGLRRVWAGAGWTLHQVGGPGVVLAGGAQLRDSSRTGLTVDVPAAGTVLLALWWADRLSLAGTGGCIRPGERDGTVVLTTTRAGRFTVGSSWSPAGHCAD